MEHMHAQYTPGKMMNAIPQQQETEDCFICHEQLKVSKSNMMLHFPKTEELPRYSVHLKCGKASDNPRLHVMSASQCVKQFGRKQFEAVRNTLREAAGPSVWGSSTFMLVEGEVADAIEQWMESRNPLEKMKDTIVRKRTQRNRQVQRITELEDQAFTLRKTLTEIEGTIHKERELLAEQKEEIKRLEQNYQDSQREANLLAKRKEMDDGHHDDVMSVKRLKTADEDD
eukprot:TRINITY_DN7021_c0_g1_i1.p1 TRINITY_DN7021_c0_g1~~TRINITY_DN7021_c0_g1_i1.p1  ORF type:complete len:251 (+),score=112.21 TRINITY_DN7021_c0_g1_i1:71-754(+)